ncbi:MAG: tRNA (N6-threonylcarbamoyladenosine(37)-N6)-methyltransferase TrmO [Gammaproteobacteria bacterium]|nr:tRNA (N6-threonylcarbamoyladenosine(37)-N6)-methyltransferase TrmO [Gammaproteobacteria bacterium]
MTHDVPIQMRPIGVVETSVADEDVARQRRRLVSDIIIFDEYAAGLEGITEYSHIIVLFWMHRAQPPSELLVYPRGDRSLPLTGVLASRGRGHPNPIGLAVAELLERNETRLHVRKLDAYDGTPIIDIKPYDHYDAHTELRVPGWFEERANRPLSQDPKTSG